MINNFSGFIYKVVRYIRDLFIDHVISPFFLFLPVKRRILFESVPDLADNTKPVFDEMIRRGLHKKYQFVWYLHNEHSKYTMIDGVKYLSPKAGKIVRNYYEYTARCLISCNLFLCSHSSRQKSYYITHGSPIKSVASYYRMPSKIDWVVAASEIMGNVIAKEMNIAPEKMLHLGYPRNDVFCHEKKQIGGLFSTSFEKLIVWYPTFRQHNAGGHSIASVGGLPIIHDPQRAERLNEYAKSQGVLIVMKPHFAQDLKYIKDLRLSNIIFIDDEFFLNKNISSYELVGAADAMITDYSSIYYDYLLNNKPIALIWEDLEVYARNPGFAIDLDFYCKAAEKIYTIEDFEKFIFNVANEVDLLEEERNEICELVNFSSDGENSKRVVDFICKDAGL